MHWPNLVTFMVKLPYRATMNLLLNITASADGLEKASKIKHFQYFLNKNEADKLHMSKPTRCERKRPAHTSKWISLCFDTLFLCLYFHIIWTDFKLSFMTLFLQICCFPIILRSLPIPPKLFTFSTPAIYLRLFNLNENIAAKSRKKTVEKRPSLPSWKR